MSASASAGQQAAITPIDLAAERAQLGPELEAAALRVLRSGRYVLGPEVDSFEAAFAGMHGVAHGVGVASGTDALWLGLSALGIEPGDEVLTSPFTFFASAATIALVGAKPTLCDVELETALLDPAAAARAMTPGTRAIVPVHLYGQLADMRALEALAAPKGVKILEDAAQAHGAVREGYHAGEVGDAATFSFYVTKNLGAAGEGGMVLTRDADTATRLRQLRDHGSPKKYVHAFVGTNSRLHALQAALLNVKLPHLEAWNARRRELAARYDAAFAGSEQVQPLTRVPASTHAYHQYTVRLLTDRKREEVATELGAQGIVCGVHYPLPVHLQEAAKPWGYGPGDFPVAERLACEVLCLPIHPFLADGDVDRVAEALLAALGQG